MKKKLRDLHKTMKLIAGTHSGSNSCSTMKYSSFSLVEAASLSAFPVFLYMKMIKRKVGSLNQREFQILLLYLKFKIWEFSTIHTGKENIMKTPMHSSLCLTIINIFPSLLSFHLFIVLFFSQQVQDIIIFKLYLLFSQTWPIIK